MQIIKEEIKKKIKEAALDEFASKGFENTSMRVIAKKVGMTVGNLYHYYKNKNDVFEAIITPFSNHIINSLQNETTSFKNLPKFLTEMICDYRLYILALIDGCKSTKLEEVKERLFRILEEHFRQDVFKTYGGSNSDVNTFVIRVITQNYIDAIVMVARFYKGKEWAERVLTDLLNFYFIEADIRLK